MRLHKPPLCLPAEIAQALVRLVPTHHDADIGVRNKAVMVGGPSVGRRLVHESLQVPHGRPHDVQAALLWLARRVVDG